MSSSSRDSPSNHSATALYLKQIKHIQAADFEKVYPADMEDSMADLAGAGAVSAGSSKVQNVMNILSSVNFENESVFDQALFKALQDDLRSNNVNIEIDKNIIVLTDPTFSDTSLAYGFARQVQGKHIFSDSPDPRKASRDEVPRLRKQGNLDHVSCIFEKDGKKWKIKEVFSVVELKMSDASCTVENEDDILQDDPMIQEVDYVLNTSWPCICRAGVGTGVTHLPMAVIAAQKQVKGKHIKASTCRWAKGRILVPEVCGGEFLVQLNSFGKFEETEVPVDGCRHACGLYLETLLFGYKLCKVYMFKERGLRPSPLSGQKLYFGNKPIENAELRGTPLRFGPRALNCFSMSQGEIFFVPEVDLDDAKDCVWLLDPPSGTIQDVYFKVWSSNVHKFWREPQIFFKDFKDLSKDVNSLSDKIKLAHFENTVIDQANLDLINAVRELSKVCIGVWNSSTVGTVSLMKVVEYSQEVRLARDIQKLVGYWDCLKVLFRDVLVPLARAGFVHYDIRPGYDITANILLQDSNEGLKMRLIDLESICTMNSYRPPTSDRRYPMVKGNSFSFVAAQCIGIVHAWLDKVNSKDVHIKQAIEWAQLFLNPKPTNEMELNILMDKLDERVKFYVNQQQSNLDK